MFRQLFDSTSSTYTYLLADPETLRAVLIDPVLEQVDRDLQLIEEMGLTLEWVVETHVHADHVTAAATLREATGCKVAYPSSGHVDGADLLLEHGQRLELGSVVLETRHTPGHTSGSASYVDFNNNRVFTGDTLLIRGCGRTDFQGGSAETLYTSVHEQLFSLSDETLVYPGHDYKGRTASSVGEEKAHNPRLGGGKTQAEFIHIMDNLNLSYPRLIDIAVPANRKLGRKEDPWTALKRSTSGAVQAPPQWVAENAGSVRLIDVREPDEYNGPLGHVPGATLVPLGTLPEVVKTWDPSQPVVLICRSGARSDRGALALESMGLAFVASMTGGTIAWNQRPAAPSCG